MSPLSASAAHRLWKYEGDGRRSRRYRLKAQWVRLSALGFSIAELARGCRQRRQSISDWIDRWEAIGFSLFEEKARPARPPKLSEAQVEAMGSWVEEEPRSKKRRGERLSREFSVEVSEDTVGRALKKKAIATNA